MKVYLLNRLIEGVFVGKENRDKEEFAGVVFLKGFVCDHKVFHEDADGVDDDEGAGGVVESLDCSRVDEELGLKFVLL